MSNHIDIKTRINEEKINFNCHCNSYSSIFNPVDWTRAAKYEYRMIKLSHVYFQYKKVKVKEKAGPRSDNFDRRFGI